MKKRFLLVLTLLLAFAMLGCDIGGDVDLSNLGSISNLGVEETDEGYKVSFDLVAFAEGYKYSLSKDGKVLENGDITSGYVFQNLEPGEYELSLHAVGDGTAYANSLVVKYNFTVDDEKIIPGSLEKVKNLKVEKNDLGYVVTFDTVVGAVSYYYTISETNQGVVKSGDVLKNLTPGEYTLSVKAIGDGTLFKDSDEVSVRFEVKEDKPEPIKLGTVTSLKVEEGSLGFVVTFDAVTGAVSYSYTLIDTDGKSTTGAIKSGDALKDLAVGSYELKVKALGDGVNYLDSNEVSTKFEVKEDKPEPIKLETVTSLKVEEGSLGFVVTFDAVTGAVSYSYTLIDTDGKSITGVIKSGDALKDLAVGSYELKVKSLGDGVNYLDSDAVTISFKVEPPIPISESIDSIKIGELGVHTAVGKVMGINAQSFILADVTGNILVYKGSTWACDVKVGDILEVTGTTSIYAGAVQFGKDITYELSTNEVIMKDPNAIEVTPEFIKGIDINNVLVQLVKAKGTVVISGNYVNLTIDGVTMTGSLSYLLPTDLNAIKLLDGKEIEVVGYGTGVTGSGKYYNILVTSYEYNEPLPKQEAPTNLAASVDGTSVTITFTGNEEIVYVYKINGEYKDIQSGKVLTDLAEGEYEISVKALGDGTNYLDSDVVTVKFTIGKVVSKPEQISIIKNGELGVHTAIGKVMGINAQSFILADETDNILVYKGSTWVCDVKVGDILEVTGTTSIYAGAVQFGKDITYELSTVNVEIKDPYAVEVTPDFISGIDINNVLVQLVKVKGVVVISGKYVNLTIDGVTMTGSLSYLLSTDLDAINLLNGKEIEVVGYGTGVTGAGKYYNILVTSYEYNEPLPKEEVPTNVTVNVNGTTITVEFTQLEDKIYSYELGTRKGTIYSGDTIENIGAGQYTFKIQTLGDDSTTLDSDFIEIPFTIEDELQNNDISYILEYGIGSYKTVGKVIALNTQSFILSDEYASILVYKGADWACDIEVGNVLEVTGTTSFYAGALQFGKDTTYTLSSEIIELYETEPYEKSGYDLTYMDKANVIIEYIKVIGTVLVSGDYVNLTIYNSDMTGSLAYLLPADLEAIKLLDGKNIEVVGYGIGVTGSGKYYSIMVESYQYVVQELSIYDVLERKSGEYSTSGTVVAINKNGFLISDGWDNILVYKGSEWTCDIAINDEVTVSGEISVYSEKTQFSSTATYEKTNTFEIEPQEANRLSHYDYENLIESGRNDYIEIIGKLSISGKYFNLDISGTTITGSIAYPLDSLNLSLLDGKMVSVKGYYLYTTGSGKYANIIATSVEEVETLGKVENIKVSCDNGELHITFDSVENANNYLLYVIEPNGQAQLYQYDSSNITYYIYDMGKYTIYVSAYDVYGDYIIGEESVIEYNYVGAVESIGYALYGANIDETIHLQGTIVAVGKDAYIISDGNDSIYVYEGKLLNSDIVVNKNIDIVGKIAEYKSMKQVTEISSYTILEDEVPCEFHDCYELDSDKIDSFYKQTDENSNICPVYSRVEGVLNVSDGYIKLTVIGTDKPLNILINLTEEELAELAKSSGQDFEVYGFNGFCLEKGMQFFATELKLIDYSIKAIVYRTVDMVPDLTEEEFDNIDEYNTYCLICEYVDAIVTAVTKNDIDDAEFKELYLSVKQAILDLDTKPEEATSFEDIYNYYKENLDVIVNLDITEETLTDILLEVLRFNMLESTLYNQKQLDEYREMREEALQKFEFDITKFYELLEMEPEYDYFWGYLDFDYETSKLLIQTEYYEDIESYMQNRIENFNTVDYVSIKYNDKYPAYYSEKYQEYYVFISDYIIATLNDTNNKLLDTAISCLKANENAFLEDIENYENLLATSNANLAYLNSLTEEDMEVYIPLIVSLKSIYNNITEEIVLDLIEGITAEEFDLTSAEKIISAKNSLIALLKEEKVTAEEFESIVRFSLTLANLVEPQVFDIFPVDFNLGATYDAYSNYVLAYFESIDAQMLVDIYEVVFSEEEQEVKIVKIACMIYNDYREFEVTADKTSIDGLELDRADLLLDILAIYGEAMEGSESSIVMFINSIDRTSLNNIFDVFEKVGYSLFDSLADEYAIIDLISLISPNGLPMEDAQELTRQVLGLLGSTLGVLTEEDITTVIESLATILPDNIYSSEEEVLFNVTEPSEELELVFDFTSIKNLLENQKGLLADLVFNLVTLIVDVQDEDINDIVKFTFLSTENKNLVYLLKGAYAVYSPNAELFDAILGNVKALLVTPEVMLLMNSKDNTEMVENIQTVYSMLVNVITAAKDYDSENLTVEQVETLNLVADMFNLTKYILLEDEIEAPIYDNENEVISFAGSKMEEGSYISTIELYVNNKEIDYSYDVDDNGNYLIDLSQIYKYLIKGENEIMVREYFYDKGCTAFSDKLIIDFSDVEILVSLELNEEEQNIEINTDREDLYYNVEYQYLNDYSEIMNTTSFTIYENVISINSIESNNYYGALSVNVIVEVYKDGYKLMEVEQIISLEKPDYTTK